MQNHPSARELVNAALGKKLSPKGQAVLDAMDGQQKRTGESVVRDQKTAPNKIHSDNSKSRKAKLLQLIDEKLAEAKSNKSASAKRKPTPSTRAEVNRQNAQRSTGPKSDSGKVASSANSLKHGFFANTAAPQPQDSTLFQTLHHDLRMGLQPDGPVEEHLIKELAMFSARLQRLESAEYSLISANIESNPIDPIMGDPVPHLDGHQIAAAFQQNAAALDQLHRIEVHLRRAYNRTWDRLATIQKERHRLPLDESLKRSQIWLTYYREMANIDEAKRTGASVVRDQEIAAIRTNRPQDIPSRHPAIDEKGKLITHKPGDPMYRPNDDDQIDTNHPNIMGYDSNTAETRS